MGASQLQEVLEETGFLEIFKSDFLVQVEQRLLWLPWLMTSTEK